MYRYGILFVCGGLGYGLLEVLYMGHTHWSMLLAGGLGFCSLYWIAARLAAPLAVQAACGALCLTGIELAFGLVFNRLLCMNVWDYSRHWGNLWGQICPLYTFLWFGLSLIVIGLFRYYHGQLDLSALHLWR